MVDFLGDSRFDRLLYVGVSESLGARLDIIQALTRNFHMDSKIDLHHIVAQCPDTLTGADYYALCSDAMLHAMSRKVREIDTQLGYTATFPISFVWLTPLIENLNYDRILTPMALQEFLATRVSTSNAEVIVHKCDFDEALRVLIPSVSPAEMHQYKVIRERFSIQSNCT